MDWILIWTALTAIVPLLVIVIGAFSFVRNNDLKTLNDKHSTLDNKMIAHDIEINKKLNEAEFRRFEDKSEKALQTIQENTRNGLDKLEAKLDEKFDKLFDMLLSK